MPTLGVLLPTLNCAPMLASHLATMQPWLDLAAEVVVVDSFSDDGTRECVERELRHPRARILTHPRGLYACWNHGLQQLTTDYAYVSTVGDAITRNGLERLLATAERWECDAVVSKPRLIDAAGRPVRAQHWAVDSLRTAFGPAPFALGGAAHAAAALAHCTTGLLGSSAGNVYRRATFAARPFPTDYGLIGDGAWSLLHAADTRLGVVADEESTFRFHPKSYTASTYHVDELRQKLVALGRATVAAKMQRDAAFAAVAEQLRLPRIAELVLERNAWQERLERERVARGPWILRPGAWAARRGRQATARELSRLLSAIARDPAATAAGLVLR